MNDQDKAELRRLAEDAVAGEWFKAGDLLCFDQKTGESHGLNVEDDRFIATAKPAAVLSLLDECAGLMAQHARDSIELSKQCHARDVARRERDKAEAERDAALAELEACRKDAERATSRIGDWVLVPRDLSDDGASVLGHFDMDSIGEDPACAAMECWHQLIKLVAREPKRLEFSNPVFKPGRNITVRRGRKWSVESIAAVQVGMSLVVVELSSLTYMFSQLSDHILRDEHDPSCRTVDGLFKEMCRVYPGFDRNEEVTVVTFYLPDVQEASNA